MLPYSVNPSFPKIEQERVESATRLRTYCDAFGLESSSPSTTRSQVGPNMIQNDVCYGALYEGFALPSPGIALKTLPLVRFEAAIDPSTVSKRRKGSRQRSEPFHLSINIFGPKSAADDVGVKYCNPQFLDFPEDGTKMSDFIGITNTSAWAQKIKISDEIGNIMDSLADVVTDSEWHPPVGLVSVLKKHQEDGVRFILQREDETFSQLLTDELRLVTAERNDPLGRCYGGVVADVMGLGKTLTMLATILHSLPSAETFGRFYDISTAESGSKIRTKSTLVVVSHVARSALNVVKFHGQCRAPNAEFLASADLVLTTYATLAAERKGQDILHRMEWYRIVLDEGTPIQNSLDDLASLAEFLRLPLFPTKAAFQKHILSPLSQGGPNFAKPLRAYLRAYCIRRTEKRLELPKSTQEVVALKLSTEEQDLYNQVLDQTRGKVDSLVSQGKTIQRYRVLFTAILRMRMLCNVGTLKPSADSAAGFLGQQARDTGCERCSAIDDDTSMLLISFQFCPDCSRPLRLASPYPELTPSPGSNGDAMNVSGTLDTRLIEPSKTISNCGASIVFSYWRSTLDLLARLFKQAGIEYVQIDGRTSYSERSKRLKAFREDTRLSAILMSVETGAVGLNLTVANRVHIVEPQWNPSVEEQAVARALRFGQTKEVAIFRYVIKGTVEQSIVNLQQKKKNLARFTFDADMDNDLDRKLEDLKFILDRGSTQEAES
ncbi:hypothetical protein DL771_000031 [Monosporascus sp. 5C6A]|nr:hypothetical protein DL771_000031 [Monosporascus sp. 5C6A]